MSFFVPQMRALQSDKPKGWFRIQNAHVDSDGSTDETTKVYIYDVIGDSWWGDATPASEFIKQMSAISTPKIELHLNSPGGDIFDGTAIYNALKYHDAHVTVVVDGLAASAASFIAQAGDEIVMREGAVMMIHDGSAGAWGFASDLRKTADILDKLSDNIATIYSNRAGNTPKFWRDLMIEETWYNAVEAVEAGLADKAEGSADKEAEAAQNRWMNFFNQSGRGPAGDPTIARERIANTLKENTVPPTPPVVPAPKATDAPPEPEKKDEDQQDTSTPQPAPDAGADKEEEDPPADPGAVPNPPAPETASTPEAKGLQAVNVAGQTFQVPAAVATELGVLRNFRNETMTQSRKDFVENLAKDKKIVATQIDKLTAYALTLSDEGYAAWAATYEDAPGLQILDRHGEGTSNHNGPQSQVVEASASEIEILKGTVNQLKLSGLSNEKIEKTPSYAKLKQLDPTFKL